MVDIEHFIETDFQFIENKSGVYVLKFNSTLFYIGGSRFLKNRMRSHFNNMRRGKACKNMQFAYNLYANPIIYIYLCSEEDIQDIEQSLITKYYNHETFLNKAPTATGYQSTHERPVYQYDLNGKYINSFKSISDASIKINVAPPNISRILSKEGKTCGGFQWSDIKYDNIDAVFKNYGKLDTYIAQYNLSGQLLKIFKTTREVANYLNTSIHSFISMLNGTGFALGFFWKRFDKNEKPPKVINTCIPKMYRRIGQYDKHGNLLRIFNTTKEIVNEFNNRAVSSYINRVCKGERNHYKGFKYKYI